MAMFIENPQLEEDLRAQREEWDADGHDEVWEGVYFMPPMANTEHQLIILRFSGVLAVTIDAPGLGIAPPGANLAASVEDWKNDYRVPDVRGIPG